jgi:hypothetical protein
VLEALLVKCPLAFLAEPPTLKAASGKSWAHSWVPGKPTLQLGLMASALAALLPSLQAAWSARRAPP